MLDIIVKFILFEIFSDFVLDVVLLKFDLTIDEATIAFEHADVIYFTKPPELTIEVFDVFNMPVYFV